MKIKRKEVYYCDFCEKKGLSKHAMKVHELVCHYNPENSRPCFSCKFLCKKEIIHFQENGRDGYNRKLQLFFCDALKVCLYTPKNQIKKNHFLLEEFENNPMPKSCEIFMNPDNTDINKILFSDVNESELFF